MNAYWTKISSNANRAKRGGRAAGKKELPSAPAPAQASAHSTTLSSAHLPGPAGAPRWKRGRLAPRVRPEQQGSTVPVTVCAALPSLSGGPRLLCPRRPPEAAAANYINYIRFKCSSVPLWLSRRSLRGLSLAVPGVHSGLCVPPSPCITGSLRMFASFPNLWHLSPVLRVDGRVESSAS